MDMPGKRPPIKIADEKAAMRLLAKSLDESIDMISKLAARLAAGGDEESFEWALKETKEKFHALLSVNDFLKKLPGDKAYTIRRKEGWQVEVTSRELMKQHKDFLDGLRTVSQIVDPDINPN